MGLAVCVNCGEWVSKCVGVGVRGGCSLQGLLCVGVNVEESKYVEVAVLGSCTETPHSAAHILHNLHNLQPPHPQHLAAPTHRDPTFLKPHIPKPPHTTTATHRNPRTQKKPTHYNPYTPQPPHNTSPTHRYSYAHWFVGPFFRGRSLFTLSSRLVAIVHVFS